MTTFASYTTKVQISYVVIVPTSAIAVHKEWLEIWWVAWRGADSHAPETYNEEQHDNNHHYKYIFERVSHYIVSDASCDQPDPARIMKPPNLAAMHREWRLARRGS